MVYKNKIHSQSREPIENAFERLTLSMRGLGIFYYTLPPAEGGVFSGRSRRLETCSKVAHLVLGSLLWLNVARFFLAYDPDDSLNATLMRKVTLHVFFLHAAAAFATCSNTSRLWHHVFTQWHAYREQHPVTDTVLVNTRRRVRICLIIWLWLFIIGTIISSILFCIFYTPVVKYMDVFQLFIAPLPEYVEDTRALEVVAIYANAVVFTVIYLPVCFIICTCLALRDEFRDFNHHFRIGMSCQSNPQETCYEVSPESTIEYYRRWHQDIIGILEQCDAWFSLFTLVCFLCDVPLISGFIYTSFFTSRLFELLLSHGVGLLLIIIFLFAIILVGTQLNCAATDAKSILYSINLSEAEITTEFALQYSTFLARVNEGHIGITGCRLFHINKFTFKVVVLMIVSYTLILLKFGTTDSSDGCQIGGATHSHDVIAQCLANCSVSP